VLARELITELQFQAMHDAATDKMKTNFNRQTIETMEERNA